jgi:membrane protein DedA with SNARE-associated domain
MDWWTEVAQATASFLDRHGLLAAFVILLIEEAGVPVPVPGDFLMLILGVQARNGIVPLWQVIVAMEAATILGSTLLYYAARLGGRGLVYRYGRFMRLTPERLDRAELWLLKHGTRAVFLGRLVPGLRIVTAVACGVFSVPAKVFLPAMSLGALLYIVVYTLLGYYIGQPVLSFLERVHLPVGLLWSLVPLVIIVVWTVRARQGLGRRVGAAAGHAHLEGHEYQVRAGAIAGGLATIASTAVLNLLLNVAGNLAFNAPGTIVERTADRLAFAIAREAEPSIILLVVVAYLTVGVLWGALYGLWGESWLVAGRPDWLRGLTYALLPFGVSTFVVMPLVGLGFLGIGATGPVAVVGELIRHATYGALLGLMYPVFRARRPVRVLPHTPDELTAESPV